MIFRGLFCTHKWNVIAESTKMVDRAGLSHNFTNWENAKVILLKCDKCGLMKKVTL